MVSCDDNRDTAVAGGSSTETSNTLAARYVDDQGTPVAGALVRIRPADWGTGALVDSILPDGRTRLDTVLDSSGRLRAGGFRHGLYTVDVVLGNISLRSELRTGQKDVIDTLQRSGGVSGRFVPGWKGRVRVVGTDILIATDDSGRFEKTGLAVGSIVLDCEADSADLVRKARVATVVPPRATASLGNIPLLTMREELSASWLHHTRWILDNTNTGITRDVDDFPLWIPLTDSILGRSDLSDLRVRDEDDSARPIHIVPPTGSVAGGMWAGMRRIDGSSNEHYLDVLWGNIEAPSWSDPVSVFDTASGWRGAWHFDRDASCAVRQCGDLAGTVSFDTGLSGSAARFDGTRTLTATDPNGSLEPSDLTVSLWVNIQSIVGTEARLLWKDSDGQSSLPSWGILLRKTGGALTVGFRMKGGPSDSGVFGPITTGRWTHIAATADRERAKAELFIDGTSAGTFAIDSVARAPTRGNLVVGIGFVGAMDELRVSRTARSASWFALERANFLQTSKLLHP